MDPIAFFLDNAALKDVDFQEPLLGNPGAGATEYMTILVANELSKRGVSVELLSTSPGKFPTNIRSRQLKDIEEAIEYCANEKIILTIRAYIADFEHLLSKIASHQDLKVVVWAHLTPSQKSLKIIAKTNQVKAIVCLENNQRVRMGDSLAASKLLTIPYGITGNTNSVSVAAQENNIAYIGALVPQKGFHFLADAWPIVVKQIPNAKLFVFGSGSLYNSRVALGSNGIATEQYEDRIFQKLERDDESVKFLGNTDSILRNQILDKCKLGIVNPSAQTETFCLSAVEFEQRGIPVIGGRKYGLLDTVSHKKSGILILNQKNLAKVIVKVLTNETLLNKLSKGAKNHVFGKYKLENVIDRWGNLFDVLSEDPTEKINPETSRMKVRSLQALFTMTNRNIVFITLGKWPTGVEIWNATKSFRRNKLNHFRWLFK